MGRCKPPGSVNSFLSYAPHLSGTKSCLFVHFKEWQCCRRLLLAFPSPATPVFLPVKSHGQRSLVGYSTWGCNESDKTERINTAQNPFQLLSSHCGVLMVAYRSFGSPHPHLGTRNGWGLCHLWFTDMSRDVFTSEGEVDFLFNLFH